MDGKAHRHKSRRNLKAADEYVRRLKKLIKDYEELAEKFPERNEAQETYRSRGVGFHEPEEEPCAVRDFLRSHPDHKGPIWIACPCRRCSFWC